MRSECFLAPHAEYFGGEVRVSRRLGGDSFSCTVWSSRKKRTTPARYCVGLHVTAVLEDPERSPRRSALGDADLAKRTAEDVLPVAGRMHQSLEGGPRRSEAVREVLPDKPSTAPGDVADQAERSYERIAARPMCEPAAVNDPIRLQLGCSIEPSAPLKQRQAVLSARLFVIADHPRGEAGAGRASPAGAGGAREQHQSGDSRRYSRPKCLSAAHSPSVRAAATEADRTSQPAETARFC
jgi:hypothetical protein